MSPLLAVDELAVRFPGRRGVVRAVDGVSFTLAHGETLGLVGESGCGKSTLGKTLVGLVRPTAGRIRLDGKDITRPRRAERRAVARRAQMIFQDPFSSLNPRLSVGRLIEEPLIVHGIGTRQSRGEMVAALMAQVGLPAAWRNRYPHEFSGGQRQRIGIARALAVDPALIVCDEPVSALDLSVQAQVINLLVRLQRERGLSYLFVSHDLSVVQHVADRVAVMYLGAFVEVAEATGMWARPLHPYTRALIAAAPVVDPGAPRRRREVVRGDVPSPVNLPSGCRFHPRCPYAVPRCAEEVPELRDLGDGHRVACHRVERRADGVLTLAGEPV